MMLSGCTYEVFLRPTHFNAVHLLSTNSAPPVNPVNFFEHCGTKFYREMLVMEM